MEITNNTYFTNELNSREKEEFLLGVINNKELREEFMEDQQVMAWVALLPREDDEEKARQSLSAFMQKRANQ